MVGASQEISLLPTRRSMTRKQYPMEAVLRGMELFHQGLSIRGAAREVGVPEATLRKKLKDREYSPPGGTTGGREVSTYLWGWEGWAFQRRRSGRSSRTVSTHHQGVGRVLTWERGGWEGGEYLPGGTLGGWEVSGRRRQYSLVG